MPDHSNKSVYLGPARPFNLPIMPNAILADYPEKVFPDLTRHFEKYPNFSKLFVSVNDLPEARVAIKTPGSPLSLISKEIGNASDEFKKTAE